VRGGRVVIAAVSVVLLALVCAGGALACSCAPTSPAESLARADAAVTARLFAVEPHGATRVTYRYEVLHVYRGRDAIEPGSTLKVTSPAGSAACALPDQVDRNYGLFLLGQRGRWVGGLCGVISPRRLWAAAHRPEDGQASGAVTSCTS
jgi:hypothetical protein